MPVDEQIDIFFNHGYIKTCNDSFASMYGFEHAHEVEGFRLAQLQGGDDNPHNIAFLKKFINSGYRLNNEISLDVDKNGNTLYISNNLVGIHENGKLVRLWGSQYNITSQVEAQKKLENSEKRYRILFENNPVPLIIFDLVNLNFVDANSAAAKLFESTHEKLLTLNLQDIRPDIAFYSREEIRTLVAKELNNTRELTLTVNSDKSIQAEVRTDQIEYEGNKAVIAAINDITPLREAEKMVIRSLIEGEDNERKRVAKEIHDSLGQNLTAASLNLSAVRSSIGCLDKSRMEKFSIGLSFLNAAIEESRNIAHNLMPKAIDDFGLVPSLKSLFSQIEKSANLKIEFYENLRVDSRLPGNVELNLYRITQEALNNVLKHANAGKIFVQLLLHKQEIIYTFEDDGKGFDLPVLSPGSKGMGIKSINNRVKAMSGFFEIDSSPAKGTSITIQIPL
jgi:PAS domain S-box-containing protein